MGVWGPHPRRPGTGGTLATGLALLSMAAGLFQSVQAHARAVFEDDRRARQALADKLVRLSQSLDMKESKYPESAGGGSQDFNRNDGNSFTSNTTYHSYVWDYCMNWIGHQYCDKWLPRYVSMHGAHGDKSPLEGVVYDAWKNMGQGGEQQAGDKTQYAIWEMEKQGGGSVLDAQGRIDGNVVTRWDLKKPVKDAVENEGYKVANRTMYLTFDENSGKNPSTMPNMESLRYMASRWTKMMRNRFVSNLGELRVNERPIEFALGEDRATCQEYVRAVQGQERDPIEERIRPQANLDPETRAQTLQQRMQNCERMRQAEVAMVNPQIQGNQVRPGSPDGEKVDQWRTRLNIAAIDQGGINPNELPKPGNVTLKKEEYSQLIADYERGGLKMNTQFVTNAEQIQSFNAALDDAAAGYKAVVARSRNIVDRSDDTRAGKVMIAQRNLVELNGLTREMKGELSDTTLPRLRDSGNNPETNLERRPSQLTTRTLQ